VIAHPSNLIEEHVSLRLRLPNQEWEGVETSRKMTMSCKGRLSS
jgi:hypothetical protein